MKGKLCPTIISLLVFASNWLVTAETCEQCHTNNRHKLLPAQQQPIDLNHIKHLSMQQLKLLLENEDILIVDARSFSEMTKGVIKNSIWVGYFTNNTWNGWFQKNVEDDQEIVLYGTLPQVQPVLKILERVGKDNIVGRVDFDISDWKGKKNPCQEPQYVDQITQNMAIIDVRSPFEWKKGVVKGSTLIQLQNVVNYVDRLDKSKTHVLVCRTGCRANIAMRILKPFGLKVKVFNHKFDQLFKYKWCQHAHF